MQNEIKQPTLLLDKKGRLTERGYAKQMNFVYNRKNVHSFPLKLKEWIFYQFVKDDWVVQLTIGHVSYCCSVSATLMNIATGLKMEIGEMKMLHVPKLDTDPQGPSKNVYRAKNFEMSFVVTDSQRILRFSGSNKQFDNVEIEIVAVNIPSNEKMVIATPFDKPTQFYLNYKENYYQATGFAKFQDFTVNLDGCTGLVDWGRGVWPYSHQWFWGNLSTNVDGVPFGFNIGWGFGDLSNATENMYFYNRKAYKVGVLTVERDVNDYMKPWKLKDEEGLMHLEFTPTYDNYTENKILFVNTHCHQMWGKFSGYVTTDKGKIEFSDLTAFIEHAVNKW